MSLADDITDYHKNRALLYQWPTLRNALDRIVDAAADRLALSEEEHFPRHSRRANAHPAPDWRGFQGASNDTAIDWLMLKMRSDPYTPVPDYWTWLQKR